MMKAKDDARNKRHRQIATLVIVAAALLLLFGLLRGEAEFVWSRAVRICLECIGIG